MGKAFCRFEWVDGRYFHPQQYLSFRIVQSQDVLSVSWFQLFPESRLFNHCCIVFWIHSTDRILCICSLTVVVEVEVSRMVHAR
jgi:hypothetical protein